MHKCIKFILFWNDTLHISEGLSVHHQQFKTVRTATGVCQILLSACKQASWFYYSNNNMMHSPMNVKYVYTLVYEARLVRPQHRARTNWLY